tara:strand:- start:6403 stop:6819 length:417 start_codon:yes stop_codon:yes gene_type:complete
MMNVNLEKAEAYLHYDEETLSLEDMVQAIYDESLSNPTTCFQDVDGVEPIEAFEYSSLSCKDFIDSCYDPYSDLKLAIDSESVNIYFDNGDDQDPTHVVYWHIDEVGEDENVAISMANAVDLFHTNPHGLLTKLGFEV